MIAGVIGGGTGEYGKRFASGLVIDESIFIDACLANINLFPEPEGSVLFLTTHGHHDHFDPDHPWKTIYSEEFSDFGGKGLEYSLYTTPGVVRYMRWWHGLESSDEMIVFEGKNILKAIPAMRGERIAFKHYRIYPTASGHFWSVRDVVSRDEAFGFAVYSDSGLLYLPDFKLSRRVVDSFASIAMNEKPFDMVILGCPNPDERPTESSHSSLEEIHEWVERMREEGILERNASIVLTHRNPNWDLQDFPANGFIKAEHGMEFIVQERRILQSFFLEL